MLLGCKLLSAVQIPHKDILRRIFGILTVSELQTAQAVHPSDVSFIYRMKRIVFPTPFCLPVAWHNPVEHHPVHLPIGFIEALHLRIQCRSQKCLKKEKFFHKKCTDAASLLTCGIFCFAVWFIFARESVRNPRHTTAVRPPQTENQLRAFLPFRSSSRDCAPEDSR